MYIKPHYFFLRNCFQTVLAMSCNTVDEWMLICQQTALADLHNDVVLQSKVFMSTVTYPNIEELPSFIPQHRRSTPQRGLTTSTDPNQLQGRQLHAYDIILQHYQSNCTSHST